MRVFLFAPLLVVTAAAPVSAQTMDGSQTEGGSAPTPAPAQSNTVVHHHHHAPPPPPRETEGDGRAADLLWVEGAFGYSYVNLAQFDSDGFLPGIEQYKGGGYMAALAAGVRLSMLMIGARGTLASYEWFDFWTIGGELHLRIPIGSLEPYVRAGAGYGFVGQANYDVPEMSDPDVFGLVIDAGAGLDIYLDKIVAIGFGVDGAYLNLTRQRVDMDGCGGTAMNPCMVGTVDFQEDGDAAGLQLRIHGHASLHF